MGGYSFAMGLIPFFRQSTPFSRLTAHGSRLTAHGSRLTRLKSQAILSFGVLGYADSLQIGVLLDTQNSSSQYGSYFFPKHRVNYLLVTQNTASGFSILFLIFHSFGKMPDACASGLSWRHGRKGVFYGHN
jgi:hypothetical protein